MVARPLIEEADRELTRAPLVAGDSRGASGPAASACFIARSAARNSAATKSEKPWPFSGGRAIARDPVRRRRRHSAECTSFGSTIITAAGPGKKETRQALLDLAGKARRIYPHRGYKSLSASALQVLVALSLDAETKQARIAERLGCDRATVIRALNELEAQGAISKGERTSRGYAVRFTPKGERLLASFVERAQPYL